jgi:ribosomal protein S6
VKDLAYRIKKSATGLYVLFPLELEGQAVSSLSSRLRLEADLIRYLLVRKD